MKIARAGLHTFALAVGALAAAPASADSDTTASVSVRAWVNRWTSWDVYPPLSAGNFSLPGASENFSSRSRVALTPSLTVRHGDFLASASHFLRKSYSFEGNVGAFTARRRETDALLGYYVLPTLALAVGFKAVDQDFGATARFKYDGPIVGAVASAPLTAGFSLYGNVGAGRLRARLPLQDASGRSQLKAGYFLGEVGLAYALRSALVPAAKGAVLTFGYRNQVLATQDFRIGVERARTRPTDLRDTTEGMTLGFSLSF